MPQDSIILNILSGSGADLKTFACVLVLHVVLILSASGFAA